ncbi:MAG: NAD(P)/FAD-dependent oxidoreductase [Rhodobacteraceae bacterium]|nr:NAD(P)/FAD-dependent oxidoreductase [Paracoccaceae bacterium]
MSEGCRVAIVGGGTAGLSLATTLRRLGVSGIVVLEREEDAGGVPRHCGHYPFGLREFKRLLKGPDYARRLVREAIAAGVDIRTGTAVTKLHKGGRLSLVCGGETYDLQAERVVLCTGVREASRAQRLISGDRPIGVMSTGALQGMVFLQGLRPFHRPVILGSELVSLSAIMTCAHAGIKPAMMLEEGPRMLARGFMRPFPALRGVPMRFGVGNIRILGNRRVEAVSYTDAGGLPREVSCDGVIVSGRFRPEAALMQDSPLEIDPDTGGPVIDQFGRCSDPHYFASGNLLRPVETSGWCWQEARDTAKRVAADLAQEARAQATVTLSVNSPELRFVLPQRLVPDAPPGGMAQMQLRLNKPVSGRLYATSGGQRLWSGALNTVPERRILAPIGPIITAAPIHEVLMETSVVCSMESRPPK